jgi:multidrug resistance efflux pump
MKSINTIYISALILAGVLILMNYSMQSKTASFYGFAENKETEINHINDVLVEKIYVENGQEVKKGDLLIEVKDANLPARIDELKLEKEAIEQTVIQKKSEILNKIAMIELERDVRLKDLEGKIQLLEKEIALNKSLFEGLKTIDSVDDTYSNADAVKLEFMNQSRTDIMNQAQGEINMQKNMLANLATPSNVKTRIIDAEINYYEKEKDKLLIYAPSDGLIGNITCKEGENISAFSTLMNFYKHNPTLVKGYVHESMILEVQVGDILEVSSSLHPDVKIQGEVFGLGSRIVEIPERLRKIADFKTYGREVLIKIPEQNNFLQKEKVLLNTINNESGLTLGNLFTSKKPASNIGKVSKNELKD